MGRGVKMVSERMGRGVKRVSGREVGGWEGG